MTTNEPGDNKANEIYAAVIEYELEQERERAKSLEQRALAVITNSGVLVTLIFGFGALVKGQAGIASHLPLIAHIALALALVAFVVAAIMSLLTNRPRAYKPLGVRTDLQRMVVDLWTMPADSARRAIAEFRVGEIDRWRDNNMLKATSLQYAIAMECCGIGLVALSMVVILA